MGPHSKASFLTALIEAVGDQCVAIASAARKLGGTVSLDPREVLSRDIPLGPPGPVSPNGSCHLFRSASDWVALNLARADDRDAIPALLEEEVPIENLMAIGKAIASRSAACLRERAILLHLPFAVVGEASPQLPRIAQGRPASGQRSLEGIRVLDMSALWAGPLCGAILALAGAQVRKFESPSRPDSVALASPKHAAYLNGQKELVRGSIPDSLWPLIDQADILITSARPIALERLGLSPEALFPRKPDLLWVAVTAHGWQGDSAIRVGFGDDCGAAGGLLEWQDRQPHFLGDALADPLTGLAAAHAALLAIHEGQSGLLDCALAPTAAHFAQEISR